MGMMITMILILVLTAIVASEAHDQGGHWIFWCMLGFAEGVMTYFIFK